MDLDTTRDNRLLMAAAWTARSLRYVEMSTRWKPEVVKKHNRWQVREPKPPWRRLAVVAGRGPVLDQVRCREGAHWNSACRRNHWQLDTVRNNRWQVRDPEPPWRRLDGVAGRRPVLDQVR